MLTTAYVCLYSRLDRFIRLVLQFQHCSRYRVKLPSVELKGNANLQIGQLSTSTGVLIETIRYYERVGLIPRAPRSKSGYRLYRPEHLRRLVFIRRSRELGFSIREIKSLIDLTDHRERPCAAVTAMAEQHLLQVRDKQRALNRLEKALGALIASCQGGRIANCKILEALAGGAE